MVRYSEVGSSDSAFPCVSGEIVANSGVPRIHRERLEGQGVVESSLNREVIGSGLPYVILAIVAGLVAGLFHVVRNS